jgi:mono/diheme cytochrome c family protein
MRTLLLAAVLPLSLLACTGTSDKADTAEAADTDTDTAPDGAALFSANCASCHGESAEGTRTAPGLEREMGLSDSQLIRIMQDGKEEMPAIEVTDTEAQAIVDWLRELFSA